MSECAPFANASADVPALRVRWLADLPWDLPDSGPCRERGGSAMRFQTCIHPAPRTALLVVCARCQYFSLAFTGASCFLRVYGAMSAQVFIAFGTRYL
ncbi:hypothetical protein NDU88_004964 [Pleurodeles waltl]|uniref:Uncharacterized protein n=1 Tax=Pleurodeles waltl TaxID=8319 RepID=A0AAV7RHN9_PLEWA|nr:hypothetical protein NDU88_004964 [Pleurodeles waltl]